MDAGDVPFPRANDNEDCIERIAAFYKDIDASGARPVSIGGDHSITGGIIQGLGRGKLAGGEKICFLHLDAHTDVFTTVAHFLGAEKSAAHWGAYTADQELIDPTGSMQIGLRGHPRTLDWLQPSYDYGYQRRDDGGLPGARRHRCDRPDQGGSCRSVYITFDLDCLDPSVAPTVSYIEPGVTGFSMDEAVELLHAACGLNIIGGDVVCMMLTKDSPNNSTAFGLSSGVCTNDLIRATRYIEGLNVGTVNIWEQPGYRIEMSPFGTDEAACPASRAVLIPQFDSRGRRWI